MNEAGKRWLEKGVRYFFLKVAIIVPDTFSYPNATKKADLEEWRFNAQEFLARASMEKFNKYLMVFASPSLERRAKQFIKYISQNQN